jgi:hypothetical protein
VVKDAEFPVLIIMLLYVYGVVSSKRVELMHESVKMANERFGSFRETERLFGSDGPPTEKAQQPYRLILLLRQLGEWPFVAEHTLHWPTL